MYESFSTGGKAIRCITTAATNTTTNVAVQWSMSTLARPNTIGNSAVDNAPIAATVSPTSAYTVAGAEPVEPNPTRQTNHNPTMHATLMAIHITVRLAVSLHAVRDSFAMAFCNAGGGATTRTVALGADARCFHSARKMV